MTVPKFGNSGEDKLPFISKDLICHDQLGNHGKEKVEKSRIETSRDMWQVARENVQEYRATRVTQK